MKRKIVLSSMVSLLLLFVFLGCDMGTTGSDQPSNTPAIIEFPDIKALDASSYEVATLGDLLFFDPVVTENETISDWPEYSLEREIVAISAGINILGQTISSIIDGDITSFSPITERSIAAGLQLQIRDEGFRVVFDDTPATYSDTFIDHLDIVLDGEINSLTDLLALMVFEDDTITKTLTMDGRIQISGKMRNISDSDFFSSGSDEELASVLSLFVDLSIEGSDLNADTPTGLLSGRLLFSSGANIMTTFDSSGDTLYHTPVVLQVKIAPFTGVNIATLIADVTTELAKVTPDLWTIIKTQMWGSTATGDFLSITRILGSYDATSERDTRTWTNQEAFNLILALFPQDD